jgi:hypothetical protein
VLHPCIKNANRASVNLSYQSIEVSRLHATLTPLATPKRRETAATRSALRTRLYQYSVPHQVNLTSAGPCSIRPGLPPIHPPAETILALAVSLARGYVHRNHSACVFVSRFLSLFCTTFLTAHCVSLDPKVGHVTFEAWWKLAYALQPHVLYILELRPLNS